MRLSAGFLWFLVIAATTVIVAVLLASGAAASCGAADRSRDHALVNRAQTQYAAILEEDPGSDCATTGMRLLVAELCQRANRLRAAGIKEEANKRFLAILAADLPDKANRWDVGCAIRGLQTPTPRPTPCECPGPVGPAGPRGAPPPACKCGSR